MNAYLLWRDRASKVLHAHTVTHLIQAGQIVLVKIQYYVFTCSGSLKYKVSFLKEKLSAPSSIYKDSQFHVGLVLAYT